MLIIATDSVVHRRFCYDALYLRDVGEALQNYHIRTERPGESVQER